MGCGFDTCKATFFAEVYDLVRQIPKGRVLTYGKIAQMLDYPHRARYVGRALHKSPGMAGGIPCHRVVFADGSLADSFAFGGAEKQRELLESEGVVFLADGHVDMKNCLWEAAFNL